MRRHDAHQRERNGRHDNQRYDEGSEPADYQNVDENEHCGEGQSHVPKDLDGDVPFAVPLHRVVVRRVRHRRVVARQRVSGRKREMVEILVHFHDGVDRAFFRSSHVSRDINDTTQILVIDAGLDGLPFDDHQLAQGNHAAIHSVQADILQTLLRGSVRTVKFDDCGHWLPCGLIVDQADLGSRDGERQGMGHVGDGDAVLGPFDLIYAHDQSGLWVFYVPVGVNNAGSVLKDLLDLLGDLSLTSQIGTVNLRYQRLYDRWPRWNLADLDPRAIRVANRVQQRTKPFCDRVALHTALLGRQQVDLDVGLIRLTAHVVVPHQPVEVIRTGRSGVNLVVQHIGLPCKFFSQCLGDPRCLFEGCAIGHVDHYL